MDGDLVLLLLVTENRQFERIRTKKEKAIILPRFNFVGVLIFLIILVIKIAILFIFLTFLKN